MTSPSTGRWRAVRAALVVAVVLGLSTGGHLMAGGEVASWRAAVLALLLVAAGAAGVTALRLTPVRLLAALGAGQVVVHQALSWSPGGHCATDGASPLFESTTLAGCGPAGAHGSLFSDPAMLLAHLTVTVVAAAVLGHGEQLLWTVRALLAAGPLVVPEPALPEVRREVPAPVVPSRSYRAPLSECDPLRGPPATPSASPVPV